jgi:hypothetical protein
VGETFSGVDYETGVRAAQEFARSCGQAAARGYAGTGRPGLGGTAAGRDDGDSARAPAQAKGNAAAGELPPLGAAFMVGVEQLYDRELRAQIHDRW